MPPLIAGGPARDPTFDSPAVSSSLPKAGRSQGSERLQSAKAPRYAGVLKDVENMTKPQYFGAWPSLNTPLQESHLVTMVDHLCPQINGT